ncbi:MAG: hypothetical protein M5U19_18305 [Microthrixaceae bacterium]|nr:hypothetical protein [Microthrixaceae bacterium]
MNAGIDDYLDLVSHHRGSLPTIEADPNPYWMGFYATRGDLKTRCKELGRRLVAIDANEAAAVIHGVDSTVTPTTQRPAWWTAATSNHHDFVTGTSPDRVARKEQAAWLAAAIEASPWPQCNHGDDDPVGADGTATSAGEALEVRHDGHLVVVTAPWGAAGFDPRRGGALVNLTDASGTELLAGPSLELRSYADSGGLWRLGNELHGGRWSLSDAGSRHPATIHVDHHDHTVQVHVLATLSGRSVTLRHTIRSGDPTIVTRTTVEAPLRRTVTLVTCPRAAANRVLMHQPGAVVERPLRRWYEPTFWPLHSFAVARAERTDVRTLAVAAATPTGLHVDADGTTEVIVARTPFKEIAFGVVPVMAPAWGSPGPTSTPWSCRAGTTPGETGAASGSAATSPSSPTRRSATWHRVGRSGWRIRSSWIRRWRSPRSRSPTAALGSSCGSATGPPSAHREP